MAASNAGGIWQNTDR